MEDRFSLLYLEPGEIYFCDVAVTFCQDPDIKENLVKSGQKSGTSTKKEEDNKTKGIYLANRKLKCPSPRLKTPRIFRLRSVQLCKANSAINIAETILQVPPVLVILNRHQNKILPNQIWFVVD